MRPFPALRSEHRARGAGLTPGSSWSRSTWVAQRDFDSPFGFGYYDYNVVTGHATLYWNTGWNGFEAQFSAGRYLAGDWGGTVAVQRTFANGWSLGAYATKTDVTSDE